MLSRAQCLHCTLANDVTHILWFRLASSRLLRAHRMSKFAGLETCAVCHLGRWCAEGRQCAVSKYKPSLKLGHSVNTMPPPPSTYYTAGIFQRMAGHWSWRDSCSFKEHSEYDVVHDMPLYIYIYIYIYSVEWLSCVLATRQTAVAQRHVCISELLCHYLMM